MPQTRRRTGNSSGHQQTLSFGNKARISKPASTSTSLKQIKSTSTPSPSGTRSPSIAVEIISKKSSSESSPPSADDKETEPIAASASPGKLIQEQARLQVQLPKSEQDKRAEALTERDIKRYWDNEEANRLAPRVHQKDLDIHEKVLRHFDLSNQYGPCIGIARIKRWRRADMLNLNPPIEVLAVLLKDEAKGMAREKAYMDELLS